MLPKQPIPLTAMPAPKSISLAARLRRVKLFLTDVAGVMTDIPTILRAFNAKAQRRKGAKGLKRFARRSSRGRLMRASRCQPKIGFFLSHLASLRLCAFALNSDSPDKVAGFDHPPRRFGCSTLEASPFIRHACA